MGRKKMTLYGCGAAAAFLAMGTTAFACVTYKGSLTIAGNGAGAVTGNMVTGDPNGGSMAFCTGDGPTTAAKQGGTTGNGNTSVTVTVGPGVDCGGVSSNKLPQGSYDIKINNLDGWSNATGSWVFVTGSGCFVTNPPPSTVHSLSPATQTVDSAGKINNGAAFTETLPAGLTRNTLATDADVFCVGNGTDGIFAPFIMTYGT